MGSRGAHGHGSCLSLLPPVQGEKAAIVPPQQPIESCLHSPTPKPFTRRHCNQDSTGLQRCTGDPFCRSTRRGEQNSKLPVKGPTTLDESSRSLAAHPLAVHRSRHAFFFDQFLTLGYSRLSRAVLPPKLELLCSSKPCDGSIASLWVFQDPFITVNYSLPSSVWGSGTPWGLRCFWNVPYDTNNGSLFCLCLVALTGKLGRAQRSMLARFPGTWFFGPEQRTDQGTGQRGGRTEAKGQMTVGWPIEVRNGPKGPSRQIAQPTEEGMKGITRSVGFIGSYRNTILYLTQSGNHVFIHQYTAYLASDRVGPTSYMGCPFS